MAHCHHYTRKRLPQVLPPSLRTRRVPASSDRVSLGPTLLFRVDRPVSAASLRHRHGGPLRRLCDRVHCGPAGAAALSLCIRNVFPRDRTSSDHLTQTSRLTFAAFSSLLASF